MRDAYRAARPQPPSNNFGLTRALACERFELPRAIVRWPAEGAQRYCEARASAVARTGSCTVSRSRAALGTGSSTDPTMFGWGRPRCKGRVGQAAVPGKHRRELITIGGSATARPFALASADAHVEHPRVDNPLGRARRLGGHPSVAAGGQPRRSASAPPPLIGRAGRGKRIGQVLMRCTGLELAPLAK